MKIPVRFAQCFLLTIVVQLPNVRSNNNEAELEEGFENFNPIYGPTEEELLSLANAQLQPVENLLWRGPERVGEISGIAVNPAGYPVIFHRGNRVWDYGTFNENFEYQEGYRGPIVENTVLTLNPQTGEIIHGWGNQTFYLPHGITIDSSGNIWLTDIAMHQVFKYSNSGVPKMILGQKFEPGNDMEHFCKPTATAISPNGEIIVADGYCNHRLVLFDSRGTPKYSIGEDWVYLRIPHALTILPNKDVCVADREHTRIVCMNIGLSGSTGKLVPAYSIRHRRFGRIFAVTSYRGIIYVVDGPTSRKTRSEGFTIDPESRTVIGFWGPESGSFVQPHAIAICPNGTSLYVSEIGPNKVWKFDLMQINHMDYH